MDSSLRRHDRQLLIHEGMPFHSICKEGDAGGKKGRDETWEPYHVTHPTPDLPNPSLTSLKMPAPPSLPSSPR